MDAEIVRMLDWSPDHTLQQLHDTMIDILRDTFKDNGSCPAMWLIVSPAGDEAALIMTAWKSNMEKRHAIREMNRALNHGPGGGKCVAYAFTCEALMASRKVGEVKRVPKNLRDDPDAEDIAFVSSYDKDGNCLFTRFGVAYADPQQDFGRLKARDDWDLCAPDVPAKLDGLLINVFNHVDDDEPEAKPAERLRIRCPYCHRDCNGRASSIGNDAAEPRDGDALLCIGCGELGVYDSKAPYGSRKAKPDEVEHFRNDVKVRIAQALVRGFKDL